MTVLLFFYLRLQDEYIKDNQINLLITSFFTFVSRNTHIVKSHLSEIGLSRENPIKKSLALSSRRRKLFMQTEARELLN